VIPLVVPNLSGNEARYLQECVESNFVSSVGPFVGRFEEQVAGASGVAHSVAVSSGTAGLHLALVALGVGPGDLVLLPSYTFVATANAISHCGATPWLIDVERDSWNLAPSALAEALAAEATRRDGVWVHEPTGRRIAAVMPVYALGMPADMDAVVEIARDHGLPVVADAAAALGARYRGRSLGDCGADLSVFSFNGNKTFTSGGGGAITGNDAELCARVRHLSTTARDGADYDHDTVGFNYRMTNLQAAVGCAQLEQLEQFLASKRRIAATYQLSLTELPGVDAFPHPDWAEGANWLSGVVIGTRPVPQLVAGLRERGVQARGFWKPMHLQRPFVECPRGSMHVCDEVWPRVLTLPCSTQLSENDQAQVIEALRGLLRG